MRNLIYTLLACLVSLGSAAQAQDTLRVTTAGQPYKTAINVQYNGPAFAVTRFTAKHFFWRNTGLEVQVHRFRQEQVYYTALHYVWQPNLFRSERLRPYVGAGTAVLAGFYRLNVEGSDSGTLYGASGVVGLEYNFKNAPLALTAEYRTNLLNLKGNQKGHTLAPIGGFFFGGKYLMGR